LPRLFPVGAQAGGEIVDTDPFAAFGTPAPEPVQEETTAVAQDAFALLSTAPTEGEVRPGRYQLPNPLENIYGDLFGEPVEPEPAFVRITEPGIYTVKDADYHRDPVEPLSLSRGNLADAIDKTMAHAKIRHPRFVPIIELDEEDKPETKFDFGKAGHSLILEGVNVVEVVDPRDHPGARGGIPKGWTSDVMKELRAEIQSRGKLPMLPKQNKRVLEMTAAFHRQLAESELGITDLHAQGVSESTYIWQEGGTFFRVKPDWKSHERIYRGKRLILDLKTTAQSGDPTKFKPAEFGKDLQDFMYRRGVEAVEGEEFEFIFATIETTYPYLLSLVSLDSMTRDMARQKFEHAVNLWEGCITHDEWPGYPSRVCEVESKPWEISQWEVKSLIAGEGEEDGE
jgi:hypothetical protein